MQTKPSHISRAVLRVRAAWSEMEYAQRRLFEIRTGVPVNRPSVLRWPYLRH